jgi:hypothetical protein
MVESKFAGILKGRLTVTEALVPGRAEYATGIGRRRRGKKSNPDYRLRSVLIKNHVHRKATDKVRSLDDGKDLSDVINELLEQWISCEA